MGRLLGHGGHLGPVLDSLFSPRICVVVSLPGR